MLTAFKEELDSLDRAIKKKNEKMAESDVKVKELDHSIAENRKDSKLVVDAITKLEKEYVWVAEESVSFGKEGTPYDFDGMNMSDAKRHCQRLQESKQGMKKKVNEKVLTMIDKCVSYALYQCVRSAHLRPAALRRRSATSSSCTSRWSRTSRRSRRLSPSSTTTSVTPCTRRGRRSTPSLGPSLPTCCPATLPSCSHRKGWRSRTASRSRSD